MALKLPQSSGGIRPMQAQKRVVPVGQIIAAKSRSPIAESVDTLGPMLGRALQYKQQMREQAQQMAKLSHMTGEDLSGVSPEYAKIAIPHLLDQKQKEQQAEANKREVGMLGEQYGMDLTGYDEPTAKFIIAQKISQDNADKARTLRTESAQEAVRLKEREIENRDLRAFNNRISIEKQRMLNDPRVKPTFAQEIGLNQIGDIVDIARKGNTVSAVALGSRMARGMEGGGVLTDRDVVRYVQSGRLDRKAADVLSRWITGSPTDATLSEIKQIAAVMTDSFRNKVQQPIFNEYLQATAEREGRDISDIEKYIGIKYVPINEGLKELPGGAKKATHRWNPNTEEVEVIQ